MAGSSEGVALSAKQSTLILSLLIAGWISITTQSLAAATDFSQLVGAKDWRNIRNGSTIPDEGYCDQPYTVITQDGNWLCVMTTGRGHEGQDGQHVVATISSDKGKTWSELIDIEPGDGLEASWAMPLLVPSGRVYAFYDYNGDKITKLGDRTNIRADMLGWYVYKYSDDNGRTWSEKRYRLPVRHTEYDRINTFNGEVQMFWGIGEPITVQNRYAIFGFTKIAEYVVNRTEGWFFRSDNILTESDPEKLEWQMLPEGDVGLRSVDGPIASEQNLVDLSDGSLYCMYRTIEGHPCHAYSRDGGKSWTPPTYATYRPGGRLIKHPRACPRLWKCSNGKYLFWFHNHGGQSFDDRNPAWLMGGIEKDGHMHWSQPEILLYDDDINVRISYPDMIEQDGRYWITETQKSIARVHEVDPELIEGLWQQGQRKAVIKDGLVLDCDPQAITARKAEAPKLPGLASRHGFSMDMWIEPADLASGQVLLDGRNSAGKGIVLRTTQRGTIEIALCDEKYQASWDTDPGVIEPNKRHHVAVIVDGGPKIITFVVDGTVCDGATHRQFGWGRFPKQMNDINGAAAFTLAEGFDGKLHRLRVYNRAIRISEAISNYHAGN